MPNFVRAIPQTAHTFFGQPHLSQPGVTVPDAKTRALLLVVVSSLMSMCAFGAEPVDGEPIEIGSRLELMVDDHLIDKLMGSATQKLHHPQPREIVVTHDAPWEGTGSGYHTLFQDGDLYRLYYRGADFEIEEGKLKQGHPQVTCYAESHDGLNWEKPNLGIIEWEGSKENNIIFVGSKGTHNFAPFKDARPDVPAEQRYKALASADGAKGLAAYQSADGIHWKLLTEKPVITDGAFDSQNLAFWDATRGEYRSYYRDFRKGYRDIKTAVSKDFVNWEPREWLDYGDAPRYHLYTNQIQPYPRAPHLFIGLPTRYGDHGWTDSMRELPDAEHRELRATVSKRYGTAMTDLVLMTSRDGQRFHRWNDAFLRPGPERPGTWNYGQHYAICGLVTTAPTIEGQPDELSIYTSEGHWIDSRIRRYTLRVDGFASINATGEGGELRLKPVIFKGDKLTLNLSTSAVGFIKVVLQDINHKEIPGFGIDDAEPIFGDTLGREVTWKGNPDLGKIAGQPVRIRFVLKEADLFSYRFE